MGKLKVRADDINAALPFLLLALVGLDRFERPVQLQDVSWSNSNDAISSLGEVEGKPALTLNGIEGTTTVTAVGDGDPSGDVEPFIATFEIEVLPAKAVRFEITPTLLQTPAA